MKLGGRDKLCWKLNQHLVSVWVCFSFIVSDLSQVFSFLFLNFIQFNDTGCNFEQSGLWIIDLQVLLELYAPNLIYCIHILVHRYHNNKTLQP